VYWLRPVCEYVPFWSRYACPEAEIGTASCAQDVHGDIYKAA